MKKQKIKLDELWFRTSEVNWEDYVSGPISKVFEILNINTPKKHEWLEVTISKKTGFMWVRTDDYHVFQDISKFQEEFNDAWLKIYMWATKEKVFWALQA